MYSTGINFLFGIEPDVDDRGTHVDLVGPLASLDVRDHRVENIFRALRGKNFFPGFLVDDELVVRNEQKRGLFGDLDERRGAVLRELDRPLERGTSRCSR